MCILALHACSIINSLQTTVTGEQYYLADQSLLPYIKLRMWLHGTVVAQAQVVKPSPQVRNCSASQSMSGLEVAVSASCLASCFPAISSGAQLAPWPKLCGTCDKAMLPWNHAGLIAGLYLDWLVQIEGDPSSRIDGYTTTPALDYYGHNLECTPDASGCTSGGSIAFPPTVGVHAKRQTQLSRLACDTTPVRNQPRVLHAKIQHRGCFQSAIADAIVIDKYDLEMHVKVQELKHS